VAVCTHETKKKSGHRNKKGGKSREKKRGWSLLPTAVSKENHVGSGLIVHTRGGKGRDVNPLKTLNKRQYNPAWGGPVLTGQKPSTTRRL